jgi:hypothetical protein
VSTDRDVERIVRSWMDEGVTQLPDRVLDLVLDQIPATPQRRAPWLARMFSLTNNPTGLALTAAVVVALVLGITLLTRPSVGDHTEPTPTPTPRPSANPISVPGATWPLDAGIYSLPSFPLEITFEVPAGWHSCSDSLVEQSVCYTPTDFPFDTRVSFLIVENVVADPCSPGEEALEPPVGPSIDDLVAAISSLAGFEASTPVEVTVAGYHGKRFTLTTPRDPGCALNTWSTQDRTNSVSPGEVNLLHILDVNGTRLVITGDYYPEGPAATERRAALEQIIASVQISQKVTSTPAP